MSDSVARTDQAHASLRHRPRVYNLPAGLPFLDLLAKGIWDDAGGDKLVLARATVLLPTRRACRNLREAFLRLTDGAPLLLPRLQPVGDVDDDEFILNADDGELRPAAGDRAAARASCCSTNHGAEASSAATPIPASPAAPRRGARRACSTARRPTSVSLDGSTTSCPKTFAEHWQKRSSSCRSCASNWPAILAERGAIDPVAAAHPAHPRRWPQRWRAVRPPTGSIAAGSTGSIPATAELLGVVAHLPRGSVVLPGLDLELDDATWDAVAGEPSHPQHGLRGCSSSSASSGRRCGRGPAPATHGRQARARMLSEAHASGDHHRFLATRRRRRMRRFAGLAPIDAASAAGEAARSRW